VGYHAAMRWILPVVLLAASALVSALPTADPPATDDVSGLISQPAPGWKLDHWFNSEPLALEGPARQGGAGALVHGPELPAL
jgi:hypothetical protein